MNIVKKWILQEPRYFDSSQNHAHDWQARLRILTLASLMVGIIGCSDDKSEKEHAVTAVSYLTETKLAEQGDAKAQLALAYRYSKGDFVSQNDAEAVKWLCKAAEQGLDAAQSQLAWHYTLGKGVPKDDLEAVKWNRKAADQGYAFSQYKLGLCYSFGTGVPKETVAAYMWLNLAAASGCAEAIESREFIAQQMNSAQIAEAQKLSREWKPKKEIASKPNSSQ